MSTVNRINLNSISLAYCNRTLLEILTLPLKRSCTEENDLNTEEEKKEIRLLQ